jgi:hydroxymethylglutaryl-CoA synthase
MTNAKVGICDIQLYVPKLHLPIETLAQARDLEYAKLNKGLGLYKMAIPDVHEDAATMAANAVLRLIQRNDLSPQQIGRIYLGTESALDGAKPTATYVLEMLRRKFRDQHGVDCFDNCDVVDLTFACVGGVDALHNTLDWVRGGSDRIGIVVTSDFAKYELASGGEYTQGAGAVAMLVKNDPRLLVIHDTFGVGTRGVHDFYKPRRTFDKKQLIEEVLQLAGIDNLTSDEVLSKLPDTLEVSGLLDDNDEIVQVYKETPVFDGQYSNWTYGNRIREAYQHYCKLAGADHDVILDWDRIIFHLPYAFHGKRIAAELFMMAMKAAGKWDSFAEALDPEPERSAFASDEEYEKAASYYLRSITKTDVYRAFVNEKLEKAQRASSSVGNMYACSIFLALMSTLEVDLQAYEDLAGKDLGFVGYGSGSKSKVFVGTVQPGWQSVVEHFGVFDTLSESQAITYETYEQLHRGQLSQCVRPASGEFAIERIGTEGTRQGARYYHWVD